MVDKLLRLISVLTTLPDIEVAIDCFSQELASHYQADRAYIMEKMSSIDSLTGVKNRGSYLNMLRKIEYSPQKTIGFVFTDINVLNRVNEMFGYDIGYDAIRKTAKVLRKYAGEYVYRIGGDAFAAILPEMGKEAFEEICRQIGEAYAQVQEYQDAPLLCVMVPSICGSSTGR